MKTKTLFNFRQGSELAYENTQPERYWFKRPGPNCRWVPSWFRLDQHSWLRSWKLKLYEPGWFSRIDRQDKRTVVWWVQRCQHSLRIEGKAHHKTCARSNVLFSLEHSRLANLISWYIPSHIDKIQRIFDDLSRHKFYGQISREECIPTCITRRFRNDFAKLWRIAEAKNWSKYSNQS